jgi:hypothetical protein
MSHHTIEGATLMQKLASYSVQSNRFVPRDKVYVFADVMIAHPDAIDAMRGYGKWTRRWRRFKREFMWWLAGRRRAIKGLIRDSIRLSREAEK